MSTLLAARKEEEKEKKLDSVFWRESIGFDESTRKLILATWIYNKYNRKLRVASEHGVIELGN